MRLAKNPNSNKIRNKRRFGLLIEANNGCCIRCARKRRHPRERREGEGEGEG